jgi:hypothetical protein
MAWRWTPLRTSGLAPTPRAGYASAVVDGELYVAGGWDGHAAPGDAFALGLDTLRWRSLALRAREGATLEGRIFFASACVDGTFFVHGGVEATNLATTHSDVLALETSSGTLRPVRTTGEAPTLQRHSIAARGAALWVVGGTSSGRWLNDVHRLDLSPWLASDGARPATWHAVAADGFVPWPRAHACLVALPPPRPYLLLTGGGDADADFDDACASARLAALITGSRHGPHPAGLPLPLRPLRQAMAASGRQWPRLCCLRRSAACRVARRRAAPAHALLGAADQPQR